MGDFLSRFIDQPSAGGLTYSDWVDLTATITSAVSGGLDSDPDSEGASLTVATTTGTFDGATVPCNSFAWTPHSSVNDGHGEAMVVSLGTLVSHFADYDPSVHGWQIAAELVDMGDANVQQPFAFVGVETAGGALSDLLGAGWECSTTTLASSIRRINATTDTTLDSITFADTVAQALVTLVTETKTRSLLIEEVPDLNDSGAFLATAFLSGARSTSDELHLVIGTDGVDTTALTGIKMRFRVRLVTGTVGLGHTAVVA